MSTPTPRTEEALAEDYNASFVSLGQTKTAKEARTLETELTAALARIAELETLAGDRLIAFTKYKYESESLTRQLSEKDSRIAELEKDRDEIEAQLSDARSGWESAEANILDGRRQLSESQAQLASAREDTEMLNAIEANGWTIRMDSTPNADAGDYSSWWVVIEHHMAKPHEREIGRGSCFDEKLRPALRSAIDSARGVTSPPAVAETGEKDAWQDISTAPKDGKAFLTTHRLHGGFQQIGWWNGAHYTTASHQIPDDWVWTALPPPPQGKEE